MVGVFRIFVAGVVGGGLLGCRPTGPVEPPPTPPPEPVTSENGIPWAGGVAPVDTTREVGEQPASLDDPIQVDDAPGAVGVTPAADSGPCRGQATLPLKAEVQARSTELEGCADAAPSDITATGTLKYTLRVESDGRVDTIVQLEDSLGVESIRSCFESKLREPFVESPRGGCTQFVIPVSYGLGATDSMAD